VDPGRIVIDPAIRRGKPVLRGTRGSVGIVLGSLAAGMTAAEVAKGYGLRVEDALAALAYATSLVAREEVGPP
jgi:uncharacterized protein (DUF433 family)